MIFNTVLPSYYQYGNGSKNAVKNGYNPKLYFNGTKVEPVNNPYGASNFTGRPTAYSGIISLFTNWSSHKTYGITSGLNTITASIDASSEAQAVYVELMAGYTGLSTSTYAEDLEFYADGSWCSLKEMVDSGIIKPLVILDGSWTNNHGWDVLALYDNSAPTSTANHPGCDIFFMLNPGHSITQYRFETNRAWGGLDYTSWDNVPITTARFTVAPY